MNRVISSSIEYFLHQIFGKLLLTGIGNSGHIPLTLPPSSLAAFWSLMRVLFLETFS